MLVGSRCILRLCFGLLGVVHGDFGREQFGGAEN